MNTQDFISISEYDYVLPEELIAQTPLKKRDNSKLMILDKNTGKIEHEIFSNIINYLDKSDILVLNDTKVPLFFFLFVFVFLFRYLGLLFTFDGITISKWYKKAYSI